MGIISKIYSWGVQGSKSDGMNTVDWFAFLVLVILVSFLWSRVVMQIID